jgi:hypothetical protein
MNDPSRSSNTLTIPAVLISKEDGEKVEAFYKANKDNPRVLESIRLEVDFEVGKKKDIVEYEIFSSGDWSEVYQVLSELRDIHSILGDMVTYKSRYITRSSYEFSQGIYKDNLVEGCLIKGRYCPLLYFPNYETTSTSIKERCLQDYIKTNKLNPDNYWSFITRVSQLCLNGNRNTNLTECIDTQLTDIIGIKATNSIIECYINSFYPALQDRI